MTETVFDALLARLNDRKAVVGVVGLGYVGLPLAAAVGRAGFSILGFDTDPEKPIQLNAGSSYIPAVPDTVLHELIVEKRFTATSDFSRQAECDVVVICVPTPLTRHREPDLSYIRSTG